MAINGICDIYTFNVGENKDKALLSFHWLRHFLALKEVNSTKT